ncbi:MAG: hypothetical protein JWR13_6027, partial [Mycobacterium sp.]|nr:hypothetical protein [Mycobacterium sp.]
TVMPNMGRLAVEEPFSTDFAARR